MFAVHSFDSSDFWKTVGAITEVPMLVHRDNDSYIEWAEPIPEGDPAHVVVCVQSLEEAKQVAVALNAATLPATISEAENYSAQNREWNKGLSGWGEWLRLARPDLFRGRKHLLND